MEEDNKEEISYANNKEELKKDVISGSEISIPHSTSEFRHRIYSGSHDFPRQMFTGSMAEGEEMAGEKHEGLLYGTNIRQQEVLEKVRNFLISFTPEDDENLDNSPHPYYIRLMHQVHDTEQYSIALDCDHIFQFDPMLYSQLVQFPSELIPLIELQATDCFNELFAAELGEYRHTLSIRTYNLRALSRMRNLGPADIDHLVGIRGIVIRNSEVVPEMREGYFHCVICKDVVIVQVERGAISEPTYCSNCNGKNTFELIHNRCSYFDKQYVKLQETPESIPEGETPQTIQLCCYIDNVDYVKPGDRVEVTGIYKINQTRINPTMRTLRNICGTFLDVISFYVNDKKKFAFAGDEEMEKEEMIPKEAKAEKLTLPVENELLYSSEKVKRIQELAQDPDIYDKLWKDSESSIFKKVILIILFSRWKMGYEIFLNNLLYKLF